MNFSGINGYHKGIQKNKNKRNTRKLWLIIISGIIVFVGLYLLIYFCFSGEGFISPGIEMTKSNWLSFLGEYLSFTGTFVISAIALFQVWYYNKMEKERRNRERQKQIEPIFSISIIAQNSQIRNTAVTGNIYNLRSFPEYDNFTLSIENLNEYPAMNVCIFDKYLAPSLKPGERKEIQCAFADSKDVERFSKNIDIVLDQEMEKTDDRLPKSFNISYEDIDGISAYKLFDLFDMEGYKYYSLTYTETVEF